MDEGLKNEANRNPELSMTASRRSFPVIEADGI